MRIGIIFLVMSMIIDICAMESEDRLPRKKYTRAYTTDGTSTVRKVTLLSISDEDDAKLISQMQSCTDVDIVYSSPRQNSPLRRLQKLSPRSSPRGSLQFSDKSSKKVLKKIKKHFEESDNYQDLIGQGLLVAVTEKDIAKVRAILHPSPNVGDEEGRTPLIIAVQKGSVDIVRELLAVKNIDVNEADIWGNTPLHHAVLYGRDEIIKLLLYDPRVNSLRKNKENYFANHFIEHWHHVNLKELKLLFFSRSRLDAVVEEEVMALQKMFLHEEDNRINESIFLIQNRIAEDHERQKQDRELPTADKSPINHEFIKKMIQYRLATCGQNVNDQHRIKIIINKQDCF